LLVTPRRSCVAWRTHDLANREDNILILMMGYCNCNCDVDVVMGGCNMQRTTNQQVKKGPLLFFSEENSAFVLLRNFASMRAAPREEKAEGASSKVA
jgi:hypothetical protein